MELRKYQEECLDGILEAYDEGNEKILAVLPTGAGKTLIETRLTDELLKDCGAFDCIIHLCHLSDITHKNKAYYEEHGQHGQNSIVMQGHATPSYSHRVVYSTMQSMCMRARLKKWKEMPFTKKPKAIIIDEAHLYGCASYDRILEAFPDATLIGFTATPFRSNYPALNLFDKIAYTIDMEKLIEGGYLTKPELFEFTVDEKDDPARLTAAYQVWAGKERKRGLPGMLVCPTIEQAKQAKAVLMTANVRVAYFDGETSQKKVDQELARLKQGVADILVVCKKGQLGMDIPSLGFVLLPWGVKSVVSFLQIVGRVVRSHPGKETAHIYLWGSSPAVKRGQYRKMFSYTLKVKEDPEGPAASLESELEFLEFHEEPDYERIKWTREAIESCKALAAGGLPGVAGLVEQKQFPKKYAKALKRIAENIVKHGTTADGTGPASDLQRRILLEYRFDGEVVGTLSKGEASAVIAGMKQYMHRSPFTVPRGPYAGKHFSETPPMYRAKVKDPVIRGIFHRWVKAGRPKNEEQR